MMGVRSLMASKSSMARGAPTSRAMASRCSTALVEPPVAATQAMAFSKASRVSTSAGVWPRASTSMTRRPASKPAFVLRASVAPAEPLPRGAMPRNSMAVAMVLAVYCAPQAPAPGQATSSSAVSCASVIWPAAWRPTPSNTSWMVTSRPS